MAVIILTTRFWADWDHAPLEIPSAPTRTSRTLMSVRLPTQWPVDEHLELAVNRVRHEETLKQQRRARRYALLDGVGDQNSNKCCVAHKRITVAYFRDYAAKIPAKRKCKDMRSSLSRLMI